MKLGKDYARISWDGNETDHAVSRLGALLPGELGESTFMMIYFSGAKIMSLQHTATLFVFFS